MRLYSEVKQAVIDLIDRTDYVVEGVDKIDQWLEVAERQFYRTAAASQAPFELYVKGTLLAGEGQISIPADFRQLKRIVVSNGTLEQPLVLTSADEMFDRYVSEEIYLPGRFAREGAAWIVDKPINDITYTVYYYGTLAPINEVTSLVYPVTPANYTLNRITRTGTGTSLFFPTGTTAEQVDAGHDTLTPTTSATVANTQEFTFTGNQVYQWMINNASEVLIYLAACEAARYWGLTGESLQEWKNTAKHYLDAIVMDFQRLDGSGTTPKQKRTGLYTTRRR